MNPLKFFQHQQSIPCLGGKMNKSMNDFYSECFVLGKETGLLIWKERPLEHFAHDGSRRRWNNRYAGKVAGGPHREGYIAVSLYVYGKRHVLLAHRIIWEMLYGELPPTVDHINGVRTDNRPVNLRAATYAQNTVNKGSYTGRPKGTSFCKRTKRYVAQITVNNKNIFLGRHKTVEEAHAAFVAAAREHYGEFAHE